MVKTEWGDIAAMKWSHGYWRSSMPAKQTRNDSGIFLLKSFVGKLNPVDTMNTLKSLSKCLCVQKCKFRSINSYLVIYWSKQGRAIVADDKMS